MTKADVLLGLQWGDEGKGKVVDVLTPRYNIVARFQGGPNAGHTLEFDSRKVVLRSIPSGVFLGEENLIGSGVVLDPVLFRTEAEELLKAGVELKKILKIGKKVHLILPSHRLLDAAQEASKGASKIGTTGKGIGPTYTDKISRSGLRVGDILAPDFKERYESLRGMHLRRIESLGYPTDIASHTESEWFDAIEYLREYDLIDTEYYVNRALKEDRKILCEGAQGTMLDVDYGSYPFVTSSNTISAGACTGLGLAPQRIGDVYGIFKAYCTRVGSGPFPTELFDDTGKTMRDRGHEYGAVTGRERRCGWIDLVALKYAVMVDGATRLIMMKSDVLDVFKTIKLCTSYRIKGELTEQFPFDATAEEIEPIYTEMPGWETDLSKMRRAEEFPKAFKDYIQFIEEYLGVPVYIISVGPDREQTIIMREL